MGLELKELPDEDCEWDWKMDELIDSDNNCVFDTSTNENSGSLIHGTLSGSETWLGGEDFYGKFNVDCITPALISEFHRWRRDKVGRELSGSAQNNHNAAFNLVLDEAIERGR